MFYTKKPVTVEAITFDELVARGRDDCEKSGHIVAASEMPWSFTYKGHAITHENDDCYLIPTLEGTMKFNRGDMLVTGVQGEIYPCKMDIFEETYDRIDLADDSPDLIAVEQQRERQTFHQELVTLINRYNVEGMSDTPDWILGEFIMGCLKTFDLTMHLREEHYGRPSPITGPKEGNTLATPEEQPFDPLKEFEKMKRGEATQYQCFHCKTTIPAGEDHRCIEAVLDADLMQPFMPAPPKSKYAREDGSEPIGTMIPLIERVEADPGMATSLLLKHAEKFRFYEGQHTAKLENKDMTGPDRGATAVKAMVNAELAREIEAFLGIGPAIPQADNQA